MYIPKVFEITEVEVLRKFISENSFATLVSTRDGSPYATHLPLILDQEQSSHGTLLGHVAAANDHWRLFDGSTETLAIFHGPHSFISPSWHKTTPAVPTWNYAAVHVYGRPKVIDKDSLSALMDRLVATFDPEYARANQLPEDFKAPLLEEIVGFEIEIERIEGKFKISQNRSAEDAASVMSNLEAGESAVGRELAALMRANLGRGIRV